MRFKQFPAKMLQNDPWAWQNLTPGAQVKQLKLLCTIHAPAPSCLEGAGLFDLG